MPSTIAPSPVRLPSAVTFPNDGESVDRASTLEAGAQLANGVEYASQIADKFVNGGIVAPATPLVVRGAGLGVGSGFQVDGSSGAVIAPPSWIPRRIFVANSDNGLTVYAVSTDAFVLPGSVWTGSWTLNLDHYGAVSGVSEIEVINMDTVNTIVVFNGGVALTAVSPPAPGQAQTKRFLFLAGNWVQSKS